MPTIWLKVSRLEVRRAMPRGKGTQEVIKRARLAPVDQEPLLKEAKSNEVLETSRS
jgi:hypothetical protein